MGFTDMALSPFVALYAVPEARYAAPALHFRAWSRIADWAS